METCPASAAARRIAVSIRSSSSRCLSCASSSRTRDASAGADGPSFAATARSAAPTVGVSVRCPPSAATALNILKAAGHSAFLRGC